LRSSPTLSWSGHAAKVPALRRGPEWLRQTPISVHHGIRYRAIDPHRAPSLGQLHLQPGLRRLADIALLPGGYTATGARVRPASPTSDWVFVWCCSRRRRLPHRSGPLDSNSRRKSAEASAPVDHDPRRPLAVAANPPRLGDPPASSRVECEFFRCSR